MNHQTSPLDYIFWQTPFNVQPSCMQDIHADIAIIGAGFAGLAAAQHALKKEKKIVLLEKNICGSGASGKSSGFITPNAELSFTDFSKRFCPADANHIWNNILQGMHQIKNNIEHFNISCDFAAQDSLIAATSNHSFKTLIKEHDNLAQFNHETKIFDDGAMQQYLNSKKYSGALLYPGSFAINPFTYAQAMKKYLIQSGVDVFENSPVIEIDDHTIMTAHAKIYADQIIVCVDKDLPELGILRDDISAVQTFVTVSEPLTHEQIKNIFPQQPLLVWDTDLIYQYFRISADNRLILGGGDIFSTYASQANHNCDRITQKLCCYFKRYFPDIHFKIQYQWPGLMGISKDIAAIAGHDKRMSHIFYVAASAGLPIAWTLGSYAVDALLNGRDDLHAYFSPYRSFPISGLTQKIIGKKLSFMICNAIKQNVP